MQEDNHKRDILWKLYEHLKEYKYSEETYDVSLNDKQRADFIYLGKKLRSSGWKYRIGHDTRWDIDESKVKELIAKS